MLKARTLLFLSSFLLLVTSHAQQDTLSRPVSASYLDAICSRAGFIEKKLEAKTAQALRQFQKQEAAICRRLAKTDSLKARQLLTNAQQQYAALQQRLQHPGSLQAYLPGLDTLHSSLAFLQQNPVLLKATKGAPEKLTKALDQLQGMEGKLQQAEAVKQFLQQRKQYLSQQLGQLGFTKELKNINKQAYYYAAQLNQYKSLLKDPKKAARKGIELLSKTKLFNDFMQRNSRLAALFRLPGDPGDPAGSLNLAGLQTRVQVNGLIGRQIAAGGPGALAQVQQHLQQAQTELNQLKDKLIKRGGGGSGEMNLPEGFRPNNQKTKSFWKRLELGTTIQSQKASGYFPGITDLAVAIGYKLNDKSSLGIGASYKLGLGKDLRHIRLSHQGIGLRSFVDWKLKGSYWVTGGYELNYRAAFRQIEALRELSAWQPSGLIGISKQVSLKTKLLKSTKLQLLWDFLSYRQAPRMQPVVFRLGYVL